MSLRLRTGEISKRGPALLAAAVLSVTGCRAPEPLISFFDDESGISFAHPPRWSIGLATQDGRHYRYLTAPNIDNDPEPLSVTFIAPGQGGSIETVAEPYLSKATAVVAATSSGTSCAWSFNDSTGRPSRLLVASAGQGLFFGAWVRGSAAAMKRHEAHIDRLLAALKVESTQDWPEEIFAGLVIRAPKDWTRGSRLSNQASATMRFKSQPLSVEKGSDTTHGFITVSKEPVPPPGDLDTFNQLLKARGQDIVVVLEHHPWPGDPSGSRPAGYIDYLRSGNTLTSTRTRRFLSVRDGVALTLSCESRADVFDRLDPWCRRMAPTAHLQ